MARWPLIVHPEYRAALAEPPISTRVTWELLPPHVAILVAGNLRAQDLCQLSQASRNARRIAHDELLWRQLCRKKFCVPADARPASWRELYKFNHRVLVELFSMERSRAELPGGGGLGLAPGQPLVVPAWH